MYDDISFDIGGTKKDKLLSRIAALEAERDQLRAELDALGGVHTCSPGCEKTALCRMTNERDRLREALTTIKDLPDLSGFGASHETIFQMRCIALAALKENNDG